MLQKYCITEKHSERIKIWRIKKDQVNVLHKNVYLLIKEKEWNSNITMVCNQSLQDNKISAVMYMYMYELFLVNNVDSGISKNNFLLNNQHFNFLYKQQHPT